jgi:hypothetical protein
MHHHDARLHSLSARVRVQVAEDADAVSGRPLLLQELLSRISIVRGITTALNKQWSRGRLLVRKD